MVNMNKKTELKSQLRGLSKDFLEGNLSGEELVEVRLVMKSLVGEILEISRQENCSVNNLRTAGLNNDEISNYLAERGIVFRRIER